MAKVTKKRRTRRTPEQKAAILATAQKEGLTAKDVKKRFGVPVVTYYSWRKKSGAGKGRRRTASARGASNGTLGDRLRAAVETHMSKLMPRMVETQVNLYLETALGGRGGRRRK